MFGYALKSILRTPVKTILFIVLVVAVTVFSCLGFGMWNASAELLRRADQTYTTAALIEYVDDGYPSSTDYTPTWRSCATCSRPAAGTYSLSGIS